MTLRRLAAGTLAASVGVTLAFVGVVWADAVIGTGRYSTATGDMLNSLGVKMQARAANTAEMAAYKWSGRITRDGYATPGDGGQASYTHSASACAISGGDGGSQISSGTGGCWNIDWASVGRVASPLLFEAPTSTDSTAAIRKALATGKDVDLRAKVNWRVTDVLTLGTQKMYGVDRGNTRIIVDSGFNMAASAVIQVAPSDSTQMASYLHGVDIQFTQPGPNVARSQLIQYPPAVDFSNATRFTIGSIRVSNAWTGLRAVGNAGGFTADTLELNAYNRAIILDGLLDFAHINNLNCWPYNSNNPNVFYDKQTVCAEFGQIEALDVQSLTTFTAAVLGNANGNTGAARQIAMMQLDGDGARFENNAGDFHIGMLSSTKGTSNDTTPNIWNKAGIVIIDNIRAWGGSTGGQPYIYATGGLLAIQGGTIEQVNNNPAATSAAGGLTITNTLLKPSGNRTTPYLQSTGGCLIAKNNTSSIAADANSSGTMISLSTDLACHTVSGNDFNGLAYSVPSGAKLGQYGPNKVAPFSWSPTPQFDGGNGTFAVMRYPVQQGFYDYDANGIRFSYRMYFTHNAFSGATGNFRVGGLPYVSATLDLLPATIGEFSGFTLSGGATFPTHSIRSVTSLQGLYVMQGNGTAQSLMPASGVPTTAGTRYISGTGYIPLR